MMENSYLEYKKRCNLVKENLKEIQFNIEETAIKCGRSPKDITLLAATKTVPADIINYAISLGINCIGENRVQELCSKYDDIDKSNTDVHFIGHLQTNKVKQVVGKVSLIQSVDSVKLAKEISRISIDKGITTNVLVEVNIGKEETKSGVYKEDLEALLRSISLFNGIRVKGLMCIPPKYNNKNEVFLNFNDFFQKSIDISSKAIDNIEVKYLSMGMSSDYVDAISCGSNMIRVGRALFGARENY